MPGAPTFLQANNLVSLGSMKLFFGAAAYEGGRAITSYELEQRTSRATSEWVLVQTLGMSGAPRPSSYVAMPFVAVHAHVKGHVVIGGALPCPRACVAGNPSLSFDVPRSRLDLEYSFRVRAVNELGAGAYSAVAFIQSEAANLPASPQALDVGTPYVSAGGTRSWSYSARFSWKMVRAPAQVPCVRWHAARA